MEIPQEKFKKVANLTNVKNEEVQPETDPVEAKIFYAMADLAPINIMFANRDGIIVYINEKSKETLRKIEKLLPVPVSEIVGGSYDVFHKNPMHQRRLLSNERNLPHRTIISLGEEKLDLLVTPMKDNTGAFIGPMVTWDVVTEKLKLESQTNDYTAIMNAMSKSQAIIDFNLDGTIISANDNFLKTLGYTLEEIKGKHHSMFCETSYTSSNKYRDFWSKLNAGNYDAGAYKRIKRDGSEVWIQASYNPIIDHTGKVVRVVKFAIDITKSRNDFLNLISSLDETASQLAAASEELSAVSGQMTKNAALTSEKSNTAAANSEEVSKGVQTVATNTEEMAASIKEISKSSAEAAGI